MDGLSRHPRLRATSFALAGTLAGALVWVFVVCRSGACVPGGSLFSLGAFGAIAGALWSLPE